MRLTRQLAIGFKSFSKATPFIIKHGMAWMFLIPIAINIILFLLGFYSVGALADALFEFEWMDRNSWDFWGGDVLNEVVYWILWIGLKVLFFIVFAYVGGYVVLMLIAPLLAYASELTEKSVVGTDYPFNAVQFLKDIWRGIIIAFRNLLLELLWMVLLFLLAFIPVIGWLSPIVMFFVSAYYYGFAFLDYNNERKQRSIRESTQFIRKNKGAAVSIGSLYALFLLIPIVGPMLSGITAIVSTVAATLTQLELERAANPHLPSSQN